MTRTEGVAELVAALCFPGSAAEGRFRAALEGRLRPPSSRTELALLGRALHRLGWDAAQVEEAISLVARTADVT